MRERKVKEVLLCLQAEFRDVFWPRRKITSDRDTEMIVKIKKKKKELKEVVMYV